MHGAKVRKNLRSWKVFFRAPLFQVWLWSPKKRPLFFRPFVSLPPSNCSHNTAKGGLGENILSFFFLCLFQQGKSPSLATQRRGKIMPQRFENFKNRKRSKWKSPIRSVDRWMALCPFVLFLLMYSNRRLSSILFKRSIQRSY
jgi:hypothetical protein